MAVADSLNCCLLEMFPIAYHHHQTFSANPNYYKAGNILSPITPIQFSTMQRQNLGVPCTDKLANILLHQKILNCRLMTNYRQEIAG
ncbi:MAG: hypothetical protein F6K48_02590 [Okeania sp. SIO3H1]|uniref:hypothetical protein n=1 Tax=Okeania sp. SIO1I7 TaxID=2607772 RepID=UPI0013CB8B85|nr:hypothetical protein [Okeania sp. SIO1I7]NEN87857.1 hypothetical protein [Okeania sp. SIO3H1]NET24535.1 hypothetical protein [Okeania sp. SIO1I7]